MRVLVIGLGNDHRGDDAVGLEAARRLAPVVGGEADVRVHPGEPVDLLHAWADAELLVLIDAARIGLRPGSVRRYELAAGGLPSRGLGSSTHAFDLLVAVELANALGLLPERMVLYAVEGQRYALGDTRSEPVERALDQVVERVAREVRDARRGTVPAAPRRKGGDARA